MKLAEPTKVGLETFENSPGMELPYNLYMPSSILDWQLSSITQLHYDASRKIYVLDNIPIDAPLRDDGGPRFKLCSNGWSNQFGFGKYISDGESTFGIPPEGIVLQVEQFYQATNDMRFEYPAATGNKKRLMRVEFKLIAKEPLPQGLVHLKIYDAP